jgi:hypothetical protein
MLLLLSLLLSLLLQPAMDEAGLDIVDFVDVGIEVRPDPAAAARTSCLVYLYSTAASADSCFTATSLWICNSRDVESCHQQDLSACGTPCSA